MDQLHQIVMSVAAARQRTEQLKQIIKEREAEFCASIVALTEEYDDARIDLTGKEAMLRDATITAFEETGKKKPHPAVGIRIKTSLDYDPEWAQMWARENSPNLMMLDTKRFEKAFKAGVLPDDVLVDVIEETTATIATDLTGYLPPVEEE